MRYKEYGKSALALLKSCELFFGVFKVSNDLGDDDKYNVLCCIYYLCGHVVECAAIYYIYKRYKWEEYHNYEWIDAQQKYIFPAPEEGWNGENEFIDVKWNPSFTKKSHFDFHGRARLKRFEEKCNKRHKEEDYLKYKGWSYLMSHSKCYTVHQHNFKEWVDNVIRNDKYFDDIPYFGSSDYPGKFKDGCLLLDRWHTDLRYFYKNRCYRLRKFSNDHSTKKGEVNHDESNHDIIDDLNENKVQNLLDLCKAIVKEIKDTQKQI